MHELRAFFVIAAIAALSACANGKSSSSSANGAAIYLSNCASCHGAKGEGVAGTFPRLAENPTVTGNPSALIHIVKYGLTGKVEAAGQSFNGMMPAWSPQLHDEDIAAVLTYVRSSWGNRAPAVTAADVAGVAK